jgi:NAD-dependent DNA ligase
MNIKDIINDPYKIGNKISIKELILILDYAAQKYYNTNKEIMSDEIYDLLLNILKKRDPNNKYLRSIGHSIENAVKLPFIMPSLTKIKSDVKYFNKWTNIYQGPYHISDKIDGVSCLYYNNKLYSRGNGYFGQDITHLKSHIKGLKPNKSNFAIRGELIILKRDFIEHEKIYKNARNTVAGQVNSLIKNINKNVVKDITFIAYEIIRPKMTIHEQYLELQKLGFIVPFYKMTDNLTLKELNILLVGRRKNSEYDIDGIVVKNNNNMVINNINNRWAFKMILSDQVSEAIVLDVEWNFSKDGYIKPTILIEPVFLKNVTIRRVTGFNAKYIKNNKIGPGTIITIVRSGDVIPHIIKINKGTIGKMPSLNYLWTGSGIDIYTEKEYNEIKIKNIYHFYDTIGTRDLGQKIITKLFNNGFNSIIKIKNMNVNDFLKIENIKEKMANKLTNNIKISLNNINLYTLMTASNIFGRGLASKKLKLVTDNYNIFKFNNIYENLIKLPGFDAKTINKFIIGLPKFIKFYNLGQFKINKNKNNNKNNNKIIVFSGFRDKKLEQKLINDNWQIDDNITKNTDLLIIKNNNIKSNKIVKARKLNINIMTLNNFLVTC